MTPIRLSHRWLRVAASLGLICTLAACGGSADVGEGAPGPAAVAPSITTQPASVTVTEPAVATFSVAAAGTAPLTYQWQRNVAGTWTNLAGATAGSYTTAATTHAADNSAQFRVTVSNSAGTATSNVATLTVNAASIAPTIATPPAAQSTTVGGSATFSVTATGTAPLAYTWRINGTDVTAPGAFSVGACTGTASFAGASVTLTNLSAGCNGAGVAVVVSNSAGPATSSVATLTVNAAQSAPTITTPPAAQSTTVNGSATFSVTATGTAPLAYTWRINDTDVTTTGAFTVGACTGTASFAGASVTLANLSAGCNGAGIVVVVSNGIAPNATSSQVQLTVNIPANALTATQIVAGHEWSLVLRPDRTVWAWGGPVRDDGAVQRSNMPNARRAMRPVQMYPAALTDVRQVSGWYDGFWALRGAPGTAASRVLHWGHARNGSDGRGWDGNGAPAREGGNPAAPGTRDNEASPVEVLTGPAQPVDRVCAIRGTADRLLMIRAIDDADNTTDCNPGSPKTVWLVGGLRFSYESAGVARKVPGLPQSNQPGYSPPSAIYAQATSSGPDMIAIALEDGRAYGLGDNFYNGYGRPITGGNPRNYDSGRFGGIGGPLLMRSEWGAVRDFAGAFYHSLFAIRADGSVMVSGYNWNDELGRGDLASGEYVSGPVPVLAETCSSNTCTEYLIGVTAITSTDGLTTLALKNGQIFGWGANGNGLLGPGTPPHQIQSYARVVPSSVSGFSALSSNVRHALVIGPGNVVYAWGNGQRGALGDGVDGSTRNAPGMVTVP